jgi:phosphopantetheine adenylyltransferase
MENQKLTQEELATLKELQQNGQTVIEELGQIEFAKFSLEQRRAKTEQFLTDLQKQEQEFIQTITNKYGIGSINPETGEFIPSSTEN